MFERGRPLKDLLQEPEVPVDALWRRIAARRERAVPLGRVPSFAAALGAVFALAVFGVMYTVPRWSHVERAWFTPEVDAPLVRANGDQLGTLDTSQSGAALDVALSDGSSIHVEPQATLVTHEASARRFRAAIQRGKVLFDVKPKQARRWTIDAGDTQVEVIGTRFSVSYARGEVQVSVERGRVEVRGPRVPQGFQSLGQGDRLVVAPPVAATLEPPPATPPQAAEEPTPDPRAGARPQPQRVDQLLEDADAARLSGDVKLAARLLQRVLSGHAGDPRASLAALTLGRLQLDHLHAPRAAAVSFVRATQLGLPDALAEEGAARVVEAYAQAGERNLARAAAERYRQRFPDGPRSAQVAAWVEFD